MRDELYNDIVLQRLPVEYERIHHASYYEETNKYGLDDSRTWHTR